MRILSDFTPVEDAIILICNNQTVVTSGVKTFSVKVVKIQAFPCGAIYGVVTRNNNAVAFASFLATVGRDVEFSGAIITRP